MENTTIMDVILDKKMGSYSFDRKDFLASGELTVTITLSEYRKLIEDCATAKQRIDAANDDKYERNALNEKLEEENAKLKAELYELQKAKDVATEGDNNGKEDS